MRALGAARRAGPAAAATLLVAALAYGALAQGAFFASQLAILQALVGAALAAALLAAPPRADDLRYPPAVGCALVSAAVAASAVARGHPARAGPVVGFLATLAASAWTVRRLGAAQREAVAGGLVAVGVVVAAAGWGGVAFRAPPLALNSGGLWRAASTLTYANATAGLLAVALVVQAARGHSPYAAYLLLAGAGATLSRGGALAAAAGVGALAVFGGGRRTADALWAPALGAAVAVAALLPSVPAAASAHPALAAAGLGAGAAFVAAARRFGARLALGAVAIAAAAVLLWRPGPLVDAAGQVRAGRLAAEAGLRDRLANWGQFWDVASSRPVWGTGPGGFLIRYRTAPRDLDVGRYAHNEFLQVTAELGAVGLAAVVTALVVVGRAVLRSPLRRCARGGGLWVGAAAGLSAMLVQSATDFIWNIPVMPVAGAILAGMALPPAQGIEEERAE